ALTSTGLWALTSTGVRVLTATGLLVLTAAGLGVLTATRLRALIASGLRTLTATRLVPRHIGSTRPVVYEPTRDPQPKPDSAAFRPERLPGRVGSGNLARGLEHGDRRGESDPGEEARGDIASARRELPAD